MKSVKVIQIKLPTNEFQTFIQVEGSLLPLDVLCALLAEAASQAQTPNREPKVILFPAESLAQSVA